MMTHSADPRRPRVVMVSANAFPVMGGVETHIHEVAPRLAADGFDVTVLTTDRTGRLAQRETVNGVATIRVRAWPAQRDYYLAPGIRRLIARGGWDLVHCQGYHTFVPPLAMVSAARAHLPYLLTFHSGGHPSSVRTRLRGAQRRALRPLLARAQKLIAVSRFEADFFARELDLPAAKFATIYNGAEMKAPHDLPALDASAPLLLSVGRLERYKGHQRLIEALPIVLRSVPGARLRIAGAGQYETELLRLAAASPAHERIEVAAVDPLDRDGMARLMASASVVALLSDYEANPVAVMEALALHRRVLVADTSGLSELAQQGWARAVPNDANSEQIAAAIVERLADPEPLDLTLPTWDESAAQLAAVYREVLDR